MPILPPQTLTSSTVDPTEFYSKLIYKPDVAPHETFEVLNGALDQDNLVADPQIPAWAVQYGASAMGMSFGFDQPEFVYARQLGGGGSSDTQGDGAPITERAVLAQLTSTIFLPWDASVVLFGVQAFLCQDASLWYANGEAGTPTFEKWDYRIEFGGNVYKGLYGRLPNSRATNSGPNESPPADPGYAVETRWRFVSKFGMAKSVNKGYSRVRMSLWTGVEAPDNSKAKVVIPTGGVWILALR